MNIYMRLFKRKRDGIWYVELEGKRRSLRTTEANLARKAYRHIKEAYLAGKIRKITGECDVTLAEYTEEFSVWAETVQPRSTYRANRLALEKLKHTAGETIRLDRINRKHLDQIVADSRRAGLSVASINNYIRHARASLNKAVEWGYLGHNPLAGAKELSREHKSPNFLTRDEALRFLGSIEDLDLRRLILAYIATGRRRSELVRLRWEDVDLQNGRYLVARAKNHLSRWYLPSTRCSPQSWRR